MASSTKEKIALTALFFLSKIYANDVSYVFFFFGPMDREVLNAEPLIEIGDCF